MASNKSNDTQKDSSVKSDVFAVLKTIAPFVLIAGMGAAAVGVASHLSKKKEEKPKLLSSLSNYPSLNVHMGDSAHVQRLLRFSCISPNWQNEFFGRVEVIIQCYNIFFHLVNDVRTRKSEFAQNVSTDDLSSKLEAKDFHKYCIDIRSYMNRAILHCAKLIEAAMTCRYEVILNVVQFNRLVKSFNIYWSSVGELFLTPCNCPPKSHQEITDNQLKFNIVNMLLQTGLDHILKVGTYAPKNQTVSAKAKSESLMFNQGSYNELVTKHVAWWTMMHVTFLPQNKLLRAKMGLSEDSFFDEEEEERMKAEFEKAKRIQDKREGRKPSNAPVKHNLKSRAKIIASMSSPLVEQFKVWKTRTKSDGILDVISSPWEGFQPSPWDETFVPTSTLDTGGVSKSLDNITAKVDTCTQYMFECFEYISDSRKEITGIIAETCSQLFKNSETLIDEMDLQLKKEDIIADSSGIRVQHLHNIWTRWSSQS